MVKNFLFDLYGTLVDIRTDEHSPMFWQKISDEFFGGEVDFKQIEKSYFSLCGYVFEKLPKGAEIDLERVFFDLFSAFGNKKSHAEIEQFAKRFRELSTIKLRLFDGILDMLCELKKQGAKLYIVSNAQACFTRAEIKTLGLEKFFDGIILSSEAGYKKPSEKFFEIATLRFALQKQECVYVGNDLHDDILGSKGVGIRNVYIHTEQSGKYDGMPEPDAVANDFCHLKQILISYLKET